MAKLTQEEFLVRAVEAHGDRYDYSLAKYTSLRSTVKIICSTHGMLEQKPSCHLKGANCPKCVRDKFRKTNKTFISQSKEVHGDKYDYSLVDYQSAWVKVDIICKIHGIFKQEPISHIHGCGCPSCRIIKISGNTADFISRAREIHGEKYDYSSVEYVKMEGKVKIICPIHGVFEQDPHSHLKGSGCWNCGLLIKIEKATYTQEEWITKAKEVHDNLYDYSLVEYVHNRTKIKIICDKHGVFLQMPVQHLWGNGCPNCSNTGISVSEPEILWLDSLNVPEEHRQKILIVNGRKYKVDGFDPITNTVYEFNGDYWHGNPAIFNSNDINLSNHKTFGELYEATLQKEAALKGAGYIVVSIWENDWRKSINGGKTRS